MRWWRFLDSKKRGHRASRPPRAERSGNPSGCRDGHRILPLSVWRVTGKGATGERRPVRAKPFAAFDLAALREPARTAWQSLKTLRRGPMPTTAAGKRRSREARSNSRDPIAQRDTFSRAAEGYSGCRGVHSPPPRIRPLRGQTAPRPRRSRVLRPAGLGQDGGLGPRRLAEMLGDRRSLPDGHVPKHWPPPVPGWRSDRAPRLDETVPGYGVAFDRAFSCRRAQHVAKRLRSLPLAARRNAMTPVLQLNEHWPELICYEGPLPRNA